MTTPRRSGALRHPAVPVLLHAAIAVVAVTTSAPGRYVGENRFDQYVAPAHRLVRTLFLWDPTRGMGRVREDLWPAQLGPLTVLRGIGLDPVVAQRVWHAILLVTAAAGAAAVHRHLQGRREGDSPLGPFLAGALYGFGPYAITYLTPSNLFVAYAVAPWVVLCALRGAGTDRPWRSAAAAALLVGALGNADYPGVVLAMVPVPLAAVWAARDRGAGLRAAVGWCVRAGALTVAVSAAALWKTAAAASVFTQRVTSTETPEIVAVASSWSETWRGLGFWLTYFRTDVAARPQTGPLLTDPGVVLATFVPAIVALVALSRREVRARALLGASIVVSGALMVGLHPVDDPSPLGRVVRSVLEAGPLGGGFRTTYKAGAGLMLGVAVLFAAMTSLLARRAAGRPEGRVLVGAAAVVVLAVGSLPIVTGGLYDETRTSGPIPGYWRDAAAAIDALPGDGRLLVLPAVTRAVYTWGWVGDDVLDALITRPHAVDTAVPLSTPQAADVLAAVSDGAHDARHRPGAVAAVLRRLGISHVLVRNDLDAEASRTFPAEAIDRLRTDPSLRLAGTFGSPADAEAETGDDDEGDDSGRSTASSQDVDPPTDRAPLELYEVIGGTDGGARVVAGDDQILVSGSGDALLALGGDGDLDTAGPTRFSGGLDADAMVDALDDGGRLVLSDTNRRRVTVVSALVRDQSWTLTAGEDLDRPAGALFDRPSSQTVAWFRDATRITSTGAARGSRGAQPWTRPAAAFDGDPSTWWQTVEVRGQVGIRLRVDLRRPSPIDRIAIDPLDAARALRQVTEVAVHLSDGSTTRLDVSGGGAQVDVDAEGIEWAEIEITRVRDGDPAPVGLREVRLGDLDLEEWISLPTDVEEAAEDAPDLAEALESAPLSVVVARDRPEAPFPVEPVLRRRFRLPRPIDGTWRASVVPPDGPSVELLEEVRDVCGEESATLDGEPLGLTLADPAAALVPGEPVELASCGTAALDAGWHELRTTPGVLLDRLRLDSADVPVGTDPAPAPRPARVERVGGDGGGRVRLEVDAPDGGVLLTGQSHDDRWVATVDGDDLGPAAAYDAQSGWVLPAGRDMEVVLELRPARVHRWTKAISLVGVVVCVALVAGRRGRAGRTGRMGRVGGAQEARAASSS